MRHTEPMPPATGKRNPWIVVEMSSRIIMDDCATRKQANISAAVLEAYYRGVYQVFSREQTQEATDGHR